MAINKVAGFSEKTAPVHETRDVLALGALKVAKVAVYALAAVAIATIIVLSIKMPLLSIVILPAGIYSIKTAAERALNWVEKKEKEAVEDKDEKAIRERIIEIKRELEIHFPDKKFKIRDGKIFYIPVGTEGNQGLEIEIHCQDRSKLATHEIPGFGPGNYYQSDFLPEK